MKTAYPAIVHTEEGGLWVEFPDIEGCFTDGKTVAEAIENASEALGGCLCSMMDNGIAIPTPSDIQSIQVEDGFTTMVITDPLLYKKNTKAIKKTLTIPEWLNEEAEKRHVNFSSVLQKALLAMLQ